MRKVGIFIGIGLIFITFGFSPLVTVAADLDSTSAIGVLPIDTSNFLAAGLVTCNGPDCTFCSLMAMINGIIAWLVGIAMVIATISLAIAGFKLVYSQGNATAVTDTKGIIFNIIIGIILIISAWFMIDTLMKLAAGDKFSHWWEPFNEENCGKMFEASTDLKRDVKLKDSEVESFILDEDNLLTPDRIQSIGTVLPGGTYSPSHDTPNDTSFTYQSGIEAQRGDTSSELQMLHNCILSQVPGDVGVISSISDSNIVNGTKTWQECWDGDEQCWHTKNSCHYGNGYGMIGKSYAVDFGDENNSSDLIGAAYACGAGYAGIHNGNHVHVSAEACRGN